MDKESAVQQENERIENRDERQKTSLKQAQNSLTPLGKMSLKMAIIQLRRSLRMAKKSMSDFVEQIIEETDRLIEQDPFCRFKSNAEKEAFDAELRKLAEQAQQEIEAEIEKLVKQPLEPITLQEIDELRQYWLNDEDAKNTPFAKLCLGFLDDTERIVKQLQTLNLRQEHEEQDIMMTLGE